MEKITIELTKEEVRTLRQSLSLTKKHIDSSIWKDKDEEFMKAALLSNKLFNALYRGK